MTSLLSKIRAQLNSKKKNTPEFKKKNEEIFAACWQDYTDVTWERAVNLACYPTLYKEASFCFEYFVAGIANSRDEILKLDNYQIEHLSENSFWGTSKKSYTDAIRFGLMVSPPAVMDIEISGHSRYIDVVKEQRRNVKYLAHATEYMETIPHLILRSPLMQSSGIFENYLKVLAKTQELTLSNSNISTFSYENLTKFFASIQGISSLTLDCDDFTNLQNDFIKGPKTRFQHFCNLLHEGLPDLKHIKLINCKIGSLEGKNKSYFLNKLAQNEKLESVTLSCMNFRNDPKSLQTFIENAKFKRLVLVDTDATTLATVQEACDKSKLEEIYFGENCVKCAKSAPSFAAA